MKSKNKQIIKIPGAAVGCALGRKKEKMREILFKAKRIDNGDWVEGFFVNAKEELGNGNRTAEIITINAERICKGEYSYTKTFAVDTDTLCQYTGLLDKNGNKIWENDVVGFLDVSQYDNGYSEHYCLGQVLWDKETLSFDVTERISCESYEALDGDCEIIGNIFDNPELIGGVANE